MYKFLASLFLSIFAAICFVNSLEAAAPSNAPLKAPAKAAIKAVEKKAVPAVKKPAVVPMPISEASIGGVRTGMPLGDVVKKFGAPAYKERVEGDGIRAVIYVYNDNLKVVGRTLLTDKAPEKDLHVVSFTLKNNKYTTPSGFTCGTPLSRIEAKYGKGTKLVMPDGEVSYYYTFPQSNVELDFTVNEKNIVTKIYCGSEF